MTTPIKNPFVSAEQASDFLKSFQNALRQRDQDLRTLGPSKALHALAEACGYESWHQMNKALSQELPNAAQAKIPHHLATQKMSDFPKEAQELMHLPKQDKETITQQKPTDGSDDHFLYVSIKLAQGTDLALKMRPELQIVDAKIIFPSNLEPDSQVVKSTLLFVKSLLISMCWIKPHIYLNRSAVLLQNYLTIEGLCKLINWIQRDGNPKSKYHNYQQYLEDMVTNLPGMTLDLYARLRAGDDSAISDIPKTTKDHFGYIIMSLNETNANTNNAMHGIQLTKFENELIELSLRDVIRGSIINSLQGKVSSSILEFLYHSEFRDN